MQEPEAPIQRDDKQTRTAEPLNEWLAAVAEAHDRAAFQALFEFFAPRLKAFMHRQGTDADMAEEIVQETMVNVWRKAGQFDPAKASVSTWIFTIARNLRIDLLRKENRPMPDMNDPALVPDPEPRAPEVISRRQETSRLKQVVSGLPAEQQDVLRLAFFEEKAHAAVAAELDIPLGTVKSRIRLAFRRIRAELGESQ
ncbi:MAG: sigma-70 family RNA polymerase sigma factor [Alphaproteobacteria bacterium]|nr:sigma-70 family RNA polymerase sigma factor [Alphaproteobacteria bacterium]